MNKLEIKWQDVDLDDIIRHYANAFQPKGMKILRYEFFIDTHARRVVFELFCEPERKVDAK